MFRGLRIQHCQCCGSGYCSDMELIPGPGTSTCCCMPCTPPPKKKVKKEKLLKKRYCKIIRQSQTYPKTKCTDSRLMKEENQRANKIRKRCLLFLLYKCISKEPRCNFPFIVIAKKIILALTRLINYGENKADEL